MRSAIRRAAAFSLVEVAIAIGIVAFVMLAVLALLPLGIKSNAISAEETRAVCILSAVEADLRNTHPLAAVNGVSPLFGFTLPYALDANSNYIFNPVLVAPTSTLANGSTSKLDDSEVPVAIETQSRFQASVIYTSIPVPGSAESLRARLVVNWPGVPGTSVNDLTDSAKTSGFVETTVSFPAP